jgi:signal transduction histidine kinase
MIGTTNSRTLRRLGGVILACAGAWCGLSSSPAAAIGTDTALDIQPIAEVRSLPVAELATNPPIRIRGVVTLQASNSIVIQDDTAGIYVNFGFARERDVWSGDVIPDAVHVGDEIEIDGTIDPGGFSPPVLPREVRVLGSKPLPPARQTDPERFFSGADDSLLIEITGVVHGVEDADSDWRLNLETAGRPFVAVVTKSAIPDDPKQLVDAEVRLTGVPLSIFNTRGEFLQPRVMVGRPEWFTVVSPPPHPPFDCPPVAISSLARFRPEPFRGHRIRTQGVVIHTVPGQAVHLQDGAGGVRAATRSVEEFKPGDRVDVAGFIDRRGRVAGLTDAILQKTHSGPPPYPTMITPDEIVALNTKSTQSAVMASPGDYEGCLIRFPARLLEARVSNDGGLLVLSAGKTSVVAVAELADFLSLRRLMPGSELEVTGIVATDWKFDPTQWPATIPDRMTLIVRSADDVRLVLSPSWWTPRRLGILLGGVATVLAGSLAWAWLLRRRVKAQAALLAAEMRSRRDAAVEFDATLKERNRLAANLHDTLLQTLGGIGFQLDACEGSRSQDEAESKVHFDVARRMVNHATGELHNSVWAMRSLPIREQTFPEAIKTLAGRIGEGHAARIDVQTSGQLDDVPDFVAGNLLLIVQEAIYNALRHGRPKTITVQVSDHPPTHSIRATVQDDGAGFSVGHQQGAEQGHFGLHGMRERAERLGGSLSVASEPGSGTAVSIEVRRRDYDRDLAEPAAAGSPAPADIGVSSNGDGPPGQGITE